MGTIHASKIVSSCLFQKVIDCAVSYDEWNGRSVDARCNGERLQVHPEYESEPTPGGVLVPHGISVVISAPSIFRFTAAINPERHLKCAEILGADVSNAKATGDYAGNLLADEILKLMDATGVPMGTPARRT